MERKQHGQQRLGAPISETVNALVSAVDQKPWADFRREAAHYYFTKMIGWWLIKLIDAALSDAQLQVVAPEDVKTITVLLIRDMFRHNSRLLRPETTDARWVEDLFADVVADLELPALDDDGEPY